MTNKKSLLQDSLQELENIKNESLELAKEQLINESADLLEKKSAALFEKLISEETEGFTPSEEESVQEKDESLDEILSELKKSEEMYDSDEEEDDSDEEDEMSDDEEEIDDSDDEEEIDDSDDEEEEDDSDEEEIDDSDEEEDDSDEEEDDSDDEEDIEFGDDDDESDDDEIDSDEEDGDFMDVDVDDKVLAEAFSNKKNNKSMNESFKRNNTKMRNTKKQVLKDLRDVSFNRLVEAYYNMDENDSFIIKENENPYMEEDNYEEGYGHTMMDEDLYDEDLYDEDFDVHGGIMDEDLFEDEGEDVYHKDVYRSGGMSSEKPSMRTAPDGSRYSYEKRGRDTIMKDYPSSEEEEMFDPQDEETIYEVEMPEESWNMHETMTDEEVSRMLDEMDGESYEKPSRKLNRTMRDVEEASGMDRMQSRGMRNTSELEEMFNEMTTEELEEMSALLEDEGGMKVDVDPRKDYGMEDLSEAEIEEMIDSMNEEDFEDQMEEGIAISTQTHRGVGPGKNRGGKVQGRPERRSLAEEEMIQEGEEQLDEFWGGAKSVLGKVATDIGKLGSSAKQAVGQYADQLQKQYNSAEVGTETKKLERIAANLGLQIDNLSKRLKAAGKGDLDKIAMITSLANQMKSKSGVVNVANISNFQKANQGQAQGQPMQEDGDYTLQEQVKKLKQENKALNEGFTNKVKSLENKVYDVTISALKAGFVNKFLLEHPLRENEKLQIIHRFSNAQTKEQIKETYISLTNEFAKGQTVKDGSMLNESVQNKVGKVHRTDNAVVREKNLINENDESLRFKQLLNYNFGKKK